MLILPVYRFEGGYRSTRKNILHHLVDNRIELLVV